MMYYLSDAIASVTTIAACFCFVGVCFLGGDATAAARMIFYPLDCELHLPSIVAASSGEPSAAGPFYDCDVSLAQRKE